jgi:hypothetical protein
VAAVGQRQSAASWPAFTHVSQPVAISSRARISVPKRFGGTAWRRLALIAFTICRTGSGSRQSARTAARSEAISSAAASPLPATSPSAIRRSTPSETKS